MLGLMAKTKPVLVHDVVKSLLAYPSQQISHLDHKKRILQTIPIHLTSDVWQASAFDGGESDLHAHHIRLGKKVKEQRSNQRKCGFHLLYAAFVFISTRLLPVQVEKADVHAACPGSSPCWKNWSSRPFLGFNQLEKEGFDLYSHLRMALLSSLKVSMWTTASQRWEQGRQAAKVVSRLMLIFPAGFLRSLQSINKEPSPNSKGGKQRESIMPKLTNLEMNL